MNKKSKRIIKLCHKYIEVRKKQSEAYKKAKIKNMKNPFSDKEYKRLGKECEKIKKILREKEKIKFDCTDCGGEHCLDLNALIYVIELLDLK